MRTESNFPITAFWRRLDRIGSDAAVASRTGEGYALLGQAVFLDDRGPAALRYQLDLAPNWSTRSGQVKGFIGKQTIATRVQRTAAGWMLGDKDFGMADVLDLDLGFTPATNMVQLKRAALAVGDSTEFGVAWLDAGSDTLQFLPQRYQRLSQFDYVYHAPTFGYQATITLAPEGFAAVYPGLWEQERR
jgi:uncharacterized protein